MVPTINTFLDFRSGIYSILYVHICIYIYFEIKGLHRACIHVYVSAIYVCIYILYTYTIIYIYIYIYIYTHVSAIYRERVIV